MRTVHDVHERIARCRADARERPVFVCCFGDSTTQGWGNESIQYREAYPTRLLAALHDRYPGCPFNAINSGESGDTVRGALGRLERDVLRYEPDLTVVCFGLNDAVLDGLEGVPRYRAGLEEAVDAIAACSAVVLMTPCMMATRPNPLVPQRFAAMIDHILAVQNGGVLDAYVEALRAVAAARGLPLADAYRAWQEMAADGVDTSLLLANGVNHPFGHAHRFFVDAILACLSSPHPR